MIYYNTRIWYNSLHFNVWPINKQDSIYSNGQQLLLYVVHTREKLFLCAVCREYIQYWAERGVEVVAWTVNTKVEKEYYQELLQVSYITDSLVEDCEPHYWETSLCHS